jgi:phosphatidylethanolamine-binding protein (PEBP) family uncharacterized protein
MIDAGTVGEKLAQGQTRHWLVNGVHVSGAFKVYPAAIDKTNELSGSTVSNTSAVGITNYAGPAPPAGSGPHRYVTRIEFRFGTK